MKVTEAETLTSPRTFRTGGVPVSIVDQDFAITSFFELVQARRGGYVAVASAHGVVEAQSDPTLHSIMERARLVLPDGMPLFLLGRLRHGKAVSRVPGTEFFSGIFADRRAGAIRHFFYGGQEETVREIVRRCGEMIEPAAIVGWYCPPLRPVGAHESDAVIAMMREARPDVVWVGLSTPKQEYWMANHQALMPTTVFVGVGAAFDFFVGAKHRGPRVLRAAGFEWLWRMAQEPRRLWPRYRYVVPRMMWIFARDLGRDGIAWAATLGR